MSNKEVHEPYPAPHVPKENTGFLRVWSVNHKALSIGNGVAAGCQLWTVKGTVSEPVPSPLRNRTSMCRKFLLRKLSEDQKPYEVKRWPIAAEHKEMAEKGSLVRCNHFVTFSNVKTISENNYQPWHVSRP